MDKVIMGKSFNKNTVGIADRAKSDTVRALVKKYKAELRRERREIGIVRDDKGEP